MSSRFLVLATIGCVGALFDGRSLGEEPKSIATTSPMNAYKTGANFDPAKRVFLRHDIPLMPTVIHEGYVEDFITTPGFGSGRVPRMPVRPPAAWAELVVDSEARRPFEMKPANTSPFAILGDPDASDRLLQGYDAVNESMKLPDGTVRAVREKVWVFRSQDLMSVNGADGPAVYQIDLHTRHAFMKAKKEFKGADAKKRKLTEFETAALQKLRDGDDVVLQSSEKEMTVLGSVRAKTDCRTCHDVKEGTLLGAFTYVLTVQSQETPAADRLKDTVGLTREEISAVLTIESTGGKVTRDKGGPVRDIALTHLISQAAANGYYSDWTRYVRPRDSSLAVLSVFPELKVLNVSNAVVTDDGLRVIAKLKGLESLNVAGTRITDDGLGVLANLTGLVKLDLRGTNTTAEGLARLKMELTNCQIRHHLTEPRKGK
jgi:hypothetical protein